MRYIFFVFLYIPIFLAGQSIRILAEKKGISFRGLSAVNDQIVWVCGSKGTVGKTIDGGISWSWINIKDYEKRDFRDIEAFNDQDAILMAVDEPGLILSTSDGGKNWSTVFNDSTHGMFLDAMDFRKNGSGVVIGDPISDKIFMAQTKDFGQTWHKQNDIFSQKVINGEAMFASSGTNIWLLKNNRSMIVTGGMASRFWYKGKNYVLPISQGCNSCGGNSIAYSRSLFYGKKIVIVGGDFLNDTVSTKNCIISHNMGKTWETPEITPHGYRSCVAFINFHKIISCGTSGIDISLDGGKSWNLISKESFHVCRKTKKGSTIFLAGRDRIARLDQ